VKTPTAHRVGLLYNLKRRASEDEAEWDSPATIDAVRRAIAEKWRCVPIEAD
jgi:hypothetical protein